MLFRTPPTVLSGTNHKRDRPLDKQTDYTRTIDEKSFKIQLLRSYPVAIIRSQKTYFSSTVPVSSGGINNSFVRLCLL